MKTTRLRATTGELVIVSNAELLKKEVTNVAATQAFRIFLPFGLTYQTPTARIRAIPRMLTDPVKAQPGCHFVRCGITALAASSIDMQLVYDDESQDIDQRTDNKSAIIMAMLDMFAAEGIEFAYPTQTSFTAAPDGTLVMPYAEPCGPAQPPAPHRAPDASGRSSSTASPPR
jgi:small-conductance mechanosensitive channel